MKAPVETGPAALELYSVDDAAELLRLREALAERDAVELGKKDVIEADVLKRPLLVALRVADPYREDAVAFGRKAEMLVADVPFEKTIVPFGNNDELVRPEMLRPMTDPLPSTTEPLPSKVELGNSKVELGSSTLELPSTVPFGRMSDPLLSNVVLPMSVPLVSNVVLPMTVPLPASVELLATVPLLSNEPVDVEVELLQRRFVRSWPQKEDSRETHTTEP